MTISTRTQVKDLDHLKRLASDPVDTFAVDTFILIGIARFSHVVSYSPGEQKDEDWCVDEEHYSDVTLADTSIASAIEHGAFYVEEDQEVEADTLDFAVSAMSDQAKAILDRYHVSVLRLPEKGYSNISIPTVAITQIWYMTDSSLFLTLTGGERLLFEGKRTNDSHPSVDVPWYSLLLEYRVENR